MIEKQLNNIKVRSRKGIAMIELIFAIVIMGITLMSIPNLIYQASESGYTTIQQESIAAAASDLSLILAREWDENGTNPSSGSPILNTDSSVASLLSARDGARSRSYATGLGGAPLNASTIVAGGDGDFDDMDDVHGITGSVTLMDGTQDLIDINITVDTNVTYITDSAGSAWDSSQALTFNFPPTGTPPTGTTNIKHVSIKLTSTSSVEELADKEIIFNAFSCNLGSYKLERKVF